MGSREASKTKADLETGGSADGAQAIGPVADLIDVTELTLNIQRDAALDPKVVAANAAFARIGTHPRLHRKLFRRDWLPFLDGVYYLSLQAWETAGLPRPRPQTRLGPRSGADQFRELIRELPWAGYIQDRRDLLSVIRHIGGERERSWLGSTSPRTRPCASASAIPRRCGTNSRQKSSSPQRTPRATTTTATTTRTARRQPARTPPAWPTWSPRTRPAATSACGSGRP